MDCFCRSKLEVHMRKHQHIGKSFECHLCGMQFHRLLALKVHFSRMHISQKKQRLPCPECDKTFLERVALERHIRIVSRNIVMMFKVFDDFIFSHFGFSTKD